MGTESLDPMLSGPANKTYLDQIYDSLVGMNREGTAPDPTTGVASWELSEDRMMLTFSIRKGIKFHNGDDLTANDVKFTLDRAMGPKSLGSYSGTLKKVIKEIVVVDPYKLTMRLTAPTVDLVSQLSPLSGTETMIVPKNYITKVGDDYFNSHPVGSGPYKFADQLVGSYLKLEAVGDHWLVGQPKYKYLTFRVVPEETTRAAMLQKGEVDMLEASRDTLLALKDKGFQLFTAEGGAVVVMYFQRLDASEPFKDERVREAMNISINRDEIVQHILGGMATPISQMIGSWSVGYQKLPSYPYDPERARQLLADAGYTSGPKVYIYEFGKPELPEYKDIVLAVASQWEAVGLQPEIIPTTYAWWRENLVVPQSNFKPNSVCSALAVGNRRFWRGAVESLYLSTGKLTIANDPNLDAIIGEFGGVKTEQEYGEVSMRMATYVRDHFVMVPLFEVSRLLAGKAGLPTWSMGQMNSAYNLRDLYWRK